MADISSEDRRFFVTKPDKDFSPERNKAVIAESIKKYERMRARKQKDYVEKIAERADAVVSYLRSRAIDSGTPIEKYLGKTNLAHFQGQKIIQKIRRLANGKQIIELEEI